MLPPELNENTHEKDEIQTDFKTPSIVSPKLPVFKKSKDYYEDKPNLLLLKNLDSIVIFNNEEVAAIESTTKDGDFSDSSFVQMASAPVSVNSPEIQKSGNFKDPPFNTISPNIAQKSSRLITGKITDGQGEPIIGATIISRSGGTITDIEGDFQINVNVMDSTLAVDYVGYDKKIVKIPSHDESISIQINPNNSILDEINLVGYKAGAAKRKINQSSNVFETKVYKDMKKLVLKNKADSPYISKYQISFDEKGLPYQYNVLESNRVKFDNQLLKVAKKHKKNLPKFFNTTQTYLLNITIE